MSLPQVLWAEVHGPPVALGEFRFQRHLSTQAAFVERDSRDYTDIQFLAKWKKIVLGRLIENIVDYLHCIYQPGVQSLEAVVGFPAIEAEAEVTDHSVTFESLDRTAEFRQVCPRIVPDVKLQEIDGIDAQFFPNEVGVLENMVRRKDVLIFVC